MAITNPLDEYTLNGSPQQKALYSRKADDKTLLEFVSAKNPIEYLTGDFAVGAQNQAAADELAKQYKDYSQQLYDTQKKALAAKGINLDAYLDPSYQLYNAGEGASANRSSTVMSTQLLAKAQQDAIKLALSGSAAPDYKAKLQAQYAEADALAKKAWRDPSLRAAADRIKNLLDGLDVNANINPDVLKQENAAAARVAGALPNAGAGIGAVAPGGPIDNSMIGNATNYEQIAQAAQRGEKIGVNAGTLPVPTAQPKSNITFNPGVGANGSYTYGGRNYSTLAAAQAAARRAGEEPTYTPSAGPSISAPAKPSRSTYAPGEAGDRQYQLALDRYNAAQKGEQWTTPTQPLSPQEIIAQMDREANEEMTAELAKIKSETSRVDLSSSANLISKLEASLNSSAPPQRPNQQQLLEEQRTKLGVGELEDSLSAVDAKLEKLDADFQNVLQDEENRTVSIGGIRRRQSAQQVEYEKIKRDLSAERNSIVNQLNQKNSVINTIMSASAQDFENASRDYQNQFDRTLKMINLMQDAEDREFTREERDRDNARANFTVLANAISSGGIDWSKVDPAQKVQYQKLEMQAGLPIGTLEAYVQKPSNSWKMSTILPGVDEDGNQVATVFEQNSQTGEYRTTKLVTDYAPKGSTTVAETPEQKAEIEFRKYVSDLIGKGADDTSVRQLIARYPWLTEAQARQELGI